MSAETPDKPNPEAGEDLQQPARDYAAVWGAHAAAARWNRLLAVALLVVLALCVIGWARTARHVPEPIIVRVDSVGRADVVRPEDMHWDNDPADPVTRHFLTRFIHDHAARKRLTAKDDWARSLFFLSQEEVQKAIQRDSAAIADVLAGRDPEKDIREINLLIYPRLEPPHQAEATYVVVVADGRGGWQRQHWSATMQFEFIDVTNPAFALENPIGLVITHIRLEEASSTAPTR